MKDLNSVNLIGRLTKDVSLSKTKNGKSVVKFSVAVNDGDEVNYISCVAWNKAAELMNDYLHKGSQVALQGQLKTGSYINSNGSTVYTTEVYVNQIQFLGSVNSSQNV